MLVTTGNNGQTHTNAGKLCPSLSELHLLPLCLLPEEGQVSTISLPKCQPWEMTPKESWVKDATTVQNALEGKGQSLPPPLGMGLSRCQAPAKPIT